MAISGILLLALAGCTPVQADPPPALATLTLLVLPTSTSLPPLPPTRTPTPVPSDTPAPSPSSTPTQTLAPTLAAQPVVPGSLQVLDVANAARIQLLARLPRAGSGMDASPSAGSTGAAFALSPDGKTIAQGSGADVRLWDVRAGQVSGWLRPPSSLAVAGGALAFSPDSTRLARIYPPNHLLVWDRATGEVLAQMGGEPGATALSGLAFTGGASGPRLAASALVDGQPGMAFWDSASGKLVAARASGAPQSDGFQVSPNGRIVVQAGHEGVLRFWDGLSGQPNGQQIIYACPDALLGALFNPSGGLLALACDPSSDAQPGLRVFFYTPNYYRPEDLSLFKLMQFDFSSGGLLSFNRQSSLLAVTTGGALAGSRANQLELWGFYTHRQAASLRVLIQDIRQVAFTPDGKVMALALSDGSAMLWGVRQP